ncbi:MAG: hypothetical protein J6S49_04710 [Erysipelotrichaceae bacterium]|nr:hypothetical protein [Erysipelotrichaceae bacterium]MBO7698466.1 hypothetical protein [Erysipelotrichaceae bacterium]MBP5280130.1 hypothetical protein [Erysipelotrichaceae bacterium]
MKRNIVKGICIAELLIAIVMYFVVAYQFDNDAIINEMLPSTDFEANLLRLSIYIIPGLNIVSGVFGITFATRGILVFAGILEILGGIMTLHYQGNNSFMNAMGITMIVMGVVFIFCILTIKDLKPKKEKEK